jgi:hypothetical protein
MLYRELYPLIEKYNKMLLATDPRFCGAVRISHEDGSVLFYEYAFTRIFHDGETTWVCVFTEHHGFHIYDLEDLNGYRHYKMSWVEPIDDITKEELEALQ